ncbi:MAG TPA: SGNH/GDSL hydrolase family protein [Phycisphaerales bacterium]|nr:SGNH/GDSL hydrolase family protein [Phycisphaerales bacterium]
MLIAAFVLLVALLIAGEWYARRGLGLGDPPLYMLDDDIGYLPRPNSRVTRYGIVVEHNIFSMRCPNFDMEKTDPAQFRVLLLGDSILHGGAFTRQEELAASLIVDRLAERLGRPVLVANASVGGWAPGHMLAYLHRFGTFNADMVVVMTNSRDYGAIVRPVDVPTEKPLFALQELVMRYRHHVLHRLFPSLKPADPWNPQPKPEHAARSLDEFRQLLALCVERVPQVVVIQHWRPEELEKGTEDGNPLFAAIAREMNVPLFSNEQAFRESLRAGRWPYRDVMHPNAEGQRVLADVIESAMIEVIRRNASPQG